MDAYEPDGVVLVAGAQPVMRPIHRQSWETFSRNWNVDTQAAFHWVQAAMSAGMHGGRTRRLLVISSGAALHGSPLSGGYAPAKQAQRFLCDYARKECARMTLKLSIQTLLPQLNPNTDLGAASVAAYAALAGETKEEFVRRRFGDTPLSPAIAGREVLRLLTEPEYEAPEYLLTGRGLSALLGGETSQ
jgi:NAD(P)-dependent dehydrogenase (short-subunit alcohol dehydrogenase family)